MINIYPLTIPLYGPFALQGYGIMLVIGTLLAGIQIYRYLQSLGIAADTFTRLFSWAIVFGVLGGRVLYVLENAHTYQNFLEMLSLWQGGLSIAGGLITLIIYVPFALVKNRIPLFPTLDIVALYTPLIHAFGRLGCLWAGCCFGCETTVPWSIVYKGTTAEAPLGIALHPTQAYSALIFFLLFGLLLLIKKQHTILYRKPGLILGVYLIGACSERFFVDFLRNDRSFLPYTRLLSLHQLLALGLGIIAVGILLIRRYTAWKHSPRF